jgi:hypothetical protein
MVEQQKLSIAPFARVAVDEKRGKSDAALESHSNAGACCSQLKIGGEGKKGIMEGVVVVVKHGASFQAPIDEISGQGQHVLNVSKDCIE